MDRDDDDEEDYTVESLGREIAERLDEREVRRSNQELYADDNPRTRIEDDEDEIRQRARNQQLQLEDDRPAHDTLEDVEAKFKRDYPSHVDKDGAFSPETLELQVEYDTAKAYAEAARTAQDRHDEAAYPDLTPEIVSNMHAVESALRDPSRRAEAALGLMQAKKINVAQAYIEVTAVASALQGLSPESQRIALHRLFNESGLLAFMQRTQSIPQAIAKAERRLVGFDLGRAAEAIEQGKAVDIGDRDLQLESAHVLNRGSAKKRDKSSYERELEADVRAALAAEGDRERDELGRFKRAAKVDLETGVREAYAEVQGKRGRPSLEALRKTARESGTTLASAMSKYHAFDAALSHPELGSAALTFAWMRGGGQLGELAHVLHAAGGAQLAARLQSRQRLSDAMTAPRGPSAAVQRQQEATARALAASRSISGSTVDGGGGGQPRRTGDYNVDLEGDVRRAVYGGY